MDVIISKNLFREILEKTIEGQEALARAQERRAMFEESRDYERRALNLIEAGALTSAIVMSNLAIASAIREASTTR